MIEAVDARARGLRGRRESVGVASFARRMDWLLLGATGALVAYGLWAIAGITRNDITRNGVPVDPRHFVVRQGVYVFLGAIGLIAALFVDPELYRRYRRAIYAGTLGLMVFVLLAGAVTRGSKRWLDVGFFRFQPSEFGKLLFVLFLAGFLADRSRRIGDPRTILTAIGFAAGPIFLVFVQPDFGTALVYGFALAGVLLIAGTRWLHLAVLGAVTALAALAVLWFLPHVGMHVLKPYQESRLVGFTNPDKDPSGSTYNVRQAINAVGAGGLRGRGVAHATQTNLHFLPEHATDFVFASIAEERGFVGVSILLLLYLLVLWRALKIISVARDAFSAIVAGGIVAALLFQVFVNVGMTLGIAPITGIPLPLISLGGSSMIANLAAIGILEAIHIRGAHGRGRSQR